MTKGIISLYFATGEVMRLQFIESNALNATGQVISFHGVYDIFSKQHKPLYNNKIRIRVKGKKRWLSVESIYNKYFTNLYRGKIKDLHCYAKLVDIKSWGQYNDEWKKVNKI